MTQTYNPLLQLLNVLLNESPHPDNKLVISLIRSLLFREDYVNAPACITNSSDAGHLQDLILRLLDADSRQSKTGTTLKLNRRARRLMLKIAAKIPVIPSSLFKTEVTVGDNIEDYIDGGKFGDVIKGEFDGTLVALKVLRRGRYNDIDFCREALAWRTLNHKFVLPLIGIYQDRSTLRLYLISPYMENGTLAQWREEKNPSSQEIEDRIFEVARGLRYIHSQGIVHGDIRGLNVLLDAQFHVQIADFGLSRHFEATASKSGNKSFNFAAPELFGAGVASDDLQLITRTRESDIYAFGCLYYEIHYNKMPFADKWDGIIMRLVYEGNRPPRLEFPSLPEKGWGLIQECWAQDKEQRPTIGDVVKRMATWPLLSESDGVRPPKNTRAASMAGHASAQEEGSGEEKRRRTTGDDGQMTRKRRRR